MWVFVVSCKTKSAVPCKSGQRTVASGSTVIVEVLLLYLRYCCAVADRSGPDVNGAWRENCCLKDRSSVVSCRTAVPDVIVNTYFSKLRCEFSVHNLSF